MALDHFTLFLSSLCLLCDLCVLCGESFCERTSGLRFNYRHGAGLTRRNSLAIASGHIFDRLPRLSGSASFHGTTSMSRKSLLMAVGIALALIGGTAAVLFLLVRHEPADYHRATLPAGPK